MDPHWVMGQISQLAHETYAEGRALEIDAVCFGIISDRVLFTIAVLNLHLYHGPRSELIFVTIGQQDVNVTDIGSERSKLREN